MLDSFKSECHTHERITHLPDDFNDGVKDWGSFALQPCLLVAVVFCSGVAKNDSLHASKKDEELRIAQQG